MSATGTGVGAHAVARDAVGGTEELRMATDDATRTAHVSRSIDLGRAPAHGVVDGLLDSLAATVILMLVALSGVALYELVSSTGTRE